MNSFENALDFLKVNQLEPSEVLQTGLFTS